MTFQQKLDATIQKNNSLVCVGLDSDTPHQFTFNKTIIDATYNLVCSYKPNSAFYEARGEKGIRELKMTCDYLRKKYPKIPVILDAKRGDIGSTNESYAQYAFEYLGVDAVTLHPYLGKESLAPFLKRKDKGCFILCRTSNPGAGEFQDEMYKTVAKHVVKEWNKNKNCMLVVGATYPEELAEIRKIVGNMIILVPGIGSQGGDLKKTLKAGLNSKKSGVIISSSRSIILASQPREAALALRAAVNKFR